MVTKHNIPSSQHSQKGVVIVFATLAMAVLIGAGALALDVGNLVLSKGKLQNLADSAALTAARAIDLGGDHGEAIAAGNQVISDNLSLEGFSTSTVGETNITFEFSEILPFDTSTATAASPYVRVRIENVDIPDFLVKIFKIDLNVRASAVAGPSSTVLKACNITPLSICKGDDPSTKSGYAPHSMHVLKAASSQDSDIGSGNFMPVALTDVDGNPMSGANDFKEAMAGRFNACIDNEEGTPIPTEPGKMDGPSEGIDTRFGIYKGSLKGSEDIYKADVDSFFYTDPDHVQVKTESYVDDDGNVAYRYVPDKAYADVHNHTKYETTYADVDFEACLASSNCQNKGFYRRVIAIPVLKCDEASKSGGKMTIPLHSIGCFYLTQPLTVTKHVNDTGGSNGDWLVGEFISDCRINSGNPGVTPNDKGPHIIVLYKDPDSEDS